MVVHVYGGVDGAYDVHPMPAGKDLDCGLFGERKAEQRKGRTFRNFTLRILAPRKVLLLVLRSVKKKRRCYEWLQKTPPVFLPL